MKRNKALVVAVAVVAAQMFGIQASRAQDWFRAFVSTSSVTTNGAGELVCRRFDTWDLIRNCANEHGITNLEGMSLVYDRTADALHVVSSNTVVCTPLSFSGEVRLSNADGTKVRRLAFVYAETNLVANGSLTASESYVFGSSNQVTRFHLIGRLQFSTPPDGTHGVTIHEGVLVVGSAYPGGWAGKGPGWFGVLKPRHFWGRD